MGERLHAERQRSPRTPQMAREGIAEGEEEMKAETNLGAALRYFMAMERWTMRKLAPEIGISPATLHRLPMPEMGIHDT
jgi:hypothetical protein